MSGLVGSSKRRLAIALGTVVVLLGVVTAVGLTSAGATGVDDGAPGGDGFCVDVIDTIGLYEGNPVTQMGIRVGTIGRIESRGSHVRITFALDPGRSYPADVKAVTRSKSLLADRSLELVGNYAGGPVLVEGRCIGVENSFTPKSISEVAASASDFLKSLSDNGGDDLETALDGADRAFARTGPQASKMFENAARAAQNPDAFVADIGSSIRDMAPLTDDAVQNWDQIMSIMNQMPSVTQLGTTLFYDVARFCRGIGWTIALMYDIQRNYGEDILWPLLHGPVEDIIAYGARRAPELGQLMAMTPSVAAAMRQQESSSGALSIPYVAPTIDVGGGTAAPVNALSILLQKAGLQR
ncbi:MlaD family protein [Gordonia lacunae]|uniref:Mammalian cell entry protein n=1 Tax=Gordonia lacunae TaxID=417102 RepID=A0A2C9ZIH7_9ACTN|nr:MlaD family protein [Gordonia lacunae]OUC77675.1 mammalian cell entry protein [Gordonia lacunae]